MADYHSTNYWQRLAAGRVTRRRLVQGGVAVSGVAALGLVGCGSSNNNNASKAVAPSAAASQAAAATVPKAASAAAAATGASGTAAAAAASPAAAAAANVAPTAQSGIKTGGTINFRIEGAVPLDPVENTTYRAQVASGFHYARLFRLATGTDPKITLGRTPVPDLIDKYELAADGYRLNNSRPDGAGRVAVACAFGLV